MARQTGGSDQHPSRPFSCVEDWVAGSLGKQKAGWNVNSNRLRSEIMLGRLRLRALEE